MIIAASKVSSSYGELTWRRQRCQAGTKGTRQNAEQAEPGRIAVESIESFVGQNVEELSEFSERERSRQFAQLIRVYNERVDAVETDKSMLIEAPRQLREYVEDTDSSRVDS